MPTVCPIGNFGWGRVWVVFVADVLARVRRLLRRSTFDPVCKIYSSFDAAECFLAEHAMSKEIGI